MIYILIQFKWLIDTMYIPQKKKIYNTIYISIFENRG